MKKRKEKKRKERKGKDKLSFYTLTYSPVLDIINHADTHTHTNTQLNQRKFIGTKRRLKQYFILLISGTNSM